MRELQDSLPSSAYMRQGLSMLWAVAIRDKRSLVSGAVSGNQAAVLTPLARTAWRVGFALGSFKAALSRSSF